MTNPVANLRLRTTASRLNPLILVLAVCVGNILIVAIVLFLSLHIEFIHSLIQSGNCGSPLLAAPCSSDIVPPILLLIAGTVIGALILKGRFGKYFWLYVILLFGLQFVLLFPEEAIKTKVNHSATVGEFHSSEQTELSKLPYSIYVPGYVPKGFNLRLGTTDNIGVEPPPLTIEYDPLLQFDEEALQRSIEPPNHCDNGKRQTISCHLLLTTPSGRTLYVFDGSLTPVIAVGTTYIEITPDSSINNDELAKIVDSLHAISAADFYHSFYLPTNGFKEAQ